MNLDDLNHSTAKHVPYPGEPFDPTHEHDWADGKCQSPDCAAVLPSWANPTQKQIDQAVNHGIEYALDEIKRGNAGPQDGPLSGEWADGLTPRMVAENVGYMEDLSAHGETYAEGESTLSDAWEQGYEDTWRTYLDNIQHPGRQ